MSGEFSADDLIDAASSLSSFSGGGVRVFVPGDDLPDGLAQDYLGMWVVADFYEGAACSVQSFSDGEVILRALVLRALR